MEDRTIEQIIVDQAAKWQPCYFCPVCGCGLKSDRRCTAYWDRVRDCNCTGPPPPALKLEWRRVPVYCSKYWWFPTEIEYRNSEGQLVQPPKKGSG